MTTEHNRRSTDLLALEITKRGFIIERQEKRIAELAAEAYQVIGALASDHIATPEVTRALDYFSAIANHQEPSGAMLPFYCDWLHDSDCVTHNMPAYPNGECNCSLATPKGE